MSHKVELIDRRRTFSEYAEETGMKHRRSNISDISKSGQVENEKRVRREIANCNERRRMQSINAGFENLRILLPPTQDGEKLSKASILQQTAKLVNTLLLKVNALEQELALYRRSSGLPPSSVLADITEEVATGFARKRRTEDQGKTVESLKMAKQDAETALLDLDDGNASGRSSDCYDGNFGCSPPSTTRLPPVSSASPPESTIGTAARLEHLVMAIEQIEGPPGNTPPQLEKPPSLSDSFTYVPHGQTVYYKFPDPVSDLRPFSYGLNTTDSGSLKQNINSFAEEFVLNSSPSALPAALIPACEDKSTKEMPMDGYHPVAKLLNRPIPHKYLHRPQVVVNNSH
ncbi:unnamed protein product [Hydatigera taeniaeformis]|uniref:BHLH domain-containing protein n=1 Tax=Hydatigena taeniaeformis TaxID=6205 RepID=A0A0R3WUB5_HYDTA|nr:unnamed protein product [Hydatigera taeniaeformis]